MGMFDQFKMAQEMMKNMSPDQIKDLMSQAQDHKRMLEDTVKKVVEDEIRKRNLISREEVERMLRNQS